MPQVGIVFEPSQLGSGYYGYMAFRVFLSVVPPRDLAGCVLHHGEIPGRKGAFYCISIDCDSAAALTYFRQAFRGSMARGLAPEDARFLEDAELGKSDLALAARVTEHGELVECQSRWLMEAWQRAQGHSAPAPAPVQPSRTQSLQVTAASPAPTPPPPLATTVQPVSASPNPKAPAIPDRVPWQARWSHSGRRSLAWLISLCAAGALIPWVHWGLALCSMMMVCGLIQLITAWWRINAERELSGEDVLAEVLKSGSSRQIPAMLALAENRAVSASPLLRRMLGLARAWQQTPDTGTACLLLAEHARQERTAHHGDMEEVRFFVVAIPGLSLCTYFMAGGVDPGRFALAAATGLILLWLRSMVTSAYLMLESDVDALVRDRWLPELTKAQPQQSKVIESVIRELSQKVDAIKVPDSGSRDEQLTEAIENLHVAVKQLTPVLAGFREPFVLQAVPANNRPKAVSATA